MNGTRSDAKVILGVSCLDHGRQNTDAMAFLAANTRSAIKLLPYTPAKHLNRTSAQGITFDCPQVSEYQNEMKHSLGVSKLQTGEASFLDKIEGDTGVTGRGVLRSNNERTTLLG